MSAPFFRQKLSKKITYVIFINSNKGNALKNSSMSMNEAHIKNKQKFGRLEHFVLTKNINTNRRQGFRVLTYAQIAIL